MSAHRKQWCRLYRETITDPKLDPRSAADCWLWAVMLCLAQDYDGVVQLAPGIGYPVETLAKLAKSDDIAATADALAWFERVDMIRRLNGDVVEITHWGDRQFKSDRSTERVRRHRERKAESDCECDSDASSNEALHVSPITEESRAEQERAKHNQSFAGDGEAAVPHPDDFSRFWDAYPKQHDEPDARLAWTETNTTRPPTGDLLVIVEKWSLTEQWTKEDRRFVPKPANWLRRHGWANEPPKACNRRNTDPGGREYWGQ